MCEILVKLLDSTSPHPNSSKRGDIAAVVHDGHEWGHLERPPLYGVVVLEGVPAQRVRRWRDRWTKPNPEDPSDPLGIADGMDSHKKGWRFDLDALPRSVRRRMERRTRGRIVLSSGTPRDRDLDDVLDLVIEKKTQRTERQRGTTLPDLRD